MPVSDGHRAFSEGIRRPNVTMLPCSNASASCERFDRIARASASGFRLPGPRNLNDRGLLHIASSQQCAEVGVGGYNNSIVGRGLVENHDVFSSMQLDCADMQC